MHDAIQASELVLDAFRQRGVIGGRRAFQVERMNHGFVATERHEFVEAFLQRAHLAARDDHGGARTNRRLRRFTAKTTRGTGNHNDTPRERTRCQRPAFRETGGRQRAHVAAPATSAAMRLSSPAAWRSSTMSQPPMNSPNRNNWGNVGQFE